MSPLSLQLQYLLVHKENVFTSEINIFFKTTHCKRFRWYNFSFSLNRILLHMLKSICSFLFQCFPVLFFAKCSFSPSLHKSLYKIFFTLQTLVQVLHLLTLLQLFSKMEYHLEPLQAPEALLVHAVRWPHIVHNAPVFCDFSTTMACLFIFSPLVSSPWQTHGVAELNLMEPILEAAVFVLTLWFLFLLYLEINASSGSLSFNSLHEISHIWQLSP